MLRYLTQTPPPTLLLLLILIPLLRLPIFFEGFYTPDEAQCLLAAARVADAGALYEDAWFAGPPLQVWIYQVFRELLGDGALTGLRIFGLFWVFGLAVYLNGMLSSYKIDRRYEWLPAVLVVVLSSMPWYSLELSAELLATWPLLGAFQALLRASDDKRRPLNLLFQAGALAGIAILFSYKAAFLLVGLVVAYLVLRNPSPDEFFALLGGKVVVLLLLIGVLYLQGNLAEFLAIGLGYYWQRIGLTGSEFYPASTPETLLGLGLSWGPLMLLALLGFFHFRARFYSYVAKIRSVEVAMAIWLVMGLIALLLKFRRLDFSDFDLLIPPLAFYSARMIAFRWPRSLRLVSLTLGLSIMGLVYLSSWGLPFPQAAQSWLGDQRPYGLYGHYQQDYPLPSDLAQRWGEDSLQGRVWILDHQPQWYQALETTCTYPYLDFRMTYHKFPYLPGYNSQGRIAVEPERAIFRAFDRQPPILVIDPQGFFPAMQQRYPTLFAAYRFLESEEIGVYLHPDYD